jgi:HSP20 family protein
MTLVKWNRSGHANGNSSPAMTNNRSLLWPELFDNFTRPSELLQYFFNDSMSPLSDAIGTTLPPVNIVEHDNELVIEMAAPGMRKENFKIEQNGDQLHIRYQEEEKAGDAKRANHWRREYSFQSFERSFTLPSVVQQDQISAQYTDGILKITVPKKEEARRKPAREINIK